MADTSGKADSLPKAGAAANGVRTFAVLAVRRPGMLVLATDRPLTAPERDEARTALRGLRLVADRIEEALDDNSAQRSLDALGLGVAAGAACDGLAARIFRQGSDT